MKRMVVEYVPVEMLKEYENNAKIHTNEQIEQIKNSIEQFGMNDPIAVWKDNVIVEGHGRLIACKELGIEEVPIIRLEHMTDEQRKAYGLVHNKLTMNTGFDFERLSIELEDIDLDMGDFGFSTNDTDIDWASVEDLTEDTYEEPKKDMLQCPNCNHVDSKAHFVKANE